MAKKKVSIKCECVLHFEYDPNSPQFEETLHDFQESIIKKANERDVLIQIANHICNGRTANEMVEGVGYIKAENRTAKITGPKSGITVDTDSPTFDFEIV